MFEPFHVLMAYDGGNLYSNLKFSFNRCGDDDYGHVFE